MYMCILEYSDEGMLWMLMEERQMLVEVQRLVGLLYLEIQQVLFVLFSSSSHYNIVHSNPTHSHEFLVFFLSFFQMNKKTYFSSSFLSQMMSQSALCIYFKGVYSRDLLFTSIFLFVSLGEVSVQFEIQLLCESSDSMFNTLLYYFGYVSHKPKWFCSHVEARGYYASY